MKKSQAVCLTALLMTVITLISCVSFLFVTQKAELVYILRNRGEEHEVSLSNMLKTSLDHIGMDGYETRKSSIEQSEDIVHIDTNLEKASQVFTVSEIRDKVKAESFPEIALVHQSTRGNGYRQEGNDDTSRLDQNRDEHSNRGNRNGNRQGHHERNGHHDKHDHHERHGKHGKHGDKNCKKFHNCTRYMKDDSQSQYSSSEVVSKSPGIITTDSSTSANERFSQHTLFANFKSFQQRLKELTHLAQQKIQSSSWTAAGDWNGDESVLRLTYRRKAETLMSM